MKMKKLMAVAMAAAVFCTACGGGSGSAKSAGGANSGSAQTQAAKSGGAAQYKMKLHHDLSEESAQHKGLQEFKKIVEEKSEGRVEIQIFANNTLGTDTEVAEMMQTGSVEAGLIPTAKLSGFYAPLQVLDLPFMFSSRDSLYGVLDNEEFQAMVFEPMIDINLKGINFWESGFKQFTANKDLTCMADFKGMKFRTMESPLIIAQFEALGASPLPIDLGETYNSLQQGVVDGEENPLVTITTNKFYEVQKNCIISNHAYLAYALLFANSYWETLPEDIQNIIIDAAKESVQLERQLSQDMEEGYIKTIEESGTTVTYLSDEAKAEMAEAMKPVHEKFRDVIGSELLDKAYELEAAGR